MSTARRLTADALLKIAPRFNVAVLGAAGGIGQPLSLLMKECRYVKHVSLYDVAHAKGVAADLSHLDSPASVKGYVGDGEIEGALKGSDIIVIPAGMPRKPGMTRDDLFNVNAKIVHSLVTACGKYAPNAMVAIISNPVNSTVAIAADALKRVGAYDPKKLFGVTTLDILRARTFVAEKKGLNIDSFDVEVIGGHAGGTILPLFSKLTNVNFTQEELNALTVRTQNGGTEVVDAKAGAGSATLSMAVAAQEFLIALMRGMSGEKNVSVCTMVQSDLHKECPYFAAPTLIGPQGVAAHLGYGKLSAFEQEKLQKEVIPELAKGYKMAQTFCASIKA